MWIVLVLLVSLVLTVDLQVLTGVAGSWSTDQHLVKALYPELFTEENLRTQYSYFGGGRLEKIALSPTRLDLVKQYVCIFYPEMQMKASFKDSVIGQINVNDTIN
jgi:hypothetical protein